jgi:RNA polymerase sigma factor (sigma-70 family)
VAAPRELTELCEREHPRLVRALQLWCGDRALAEELAQEALLKAVVHWRRVRTMQSPSGWLFQVARNLAMSSHRRRSAERRALDRLPRLRPVAEATEAATVEAMALHAAMAELPERQRSALVLRHYLDLPVDEAAAALGVSPDALRQLCHRGIEGLRSRLAVDLVVTEREARYA